MITSKAVKSDRGFGLNERREFMKLPLEERRRQMSAQAANMAKHYDDREATLEREQWQGGDIVECS